MKCPKCGESIKDGAVYCDHCGEEILIVPDFELDIDFASELLAREVMESKQSEAKEELARITSQKRKKRLLIFVSIFAVVCLLFSGIFYYLYTGSYEYQIKVANAAIADENFEKAVLYLEKAVEIRPTDIDILLDLAEGYNQTNNLTKYRQTLEAVISNSLSTTMQQAKAYNKLILLLDKEKEYETIEILLDNCTINEVLIEHQRFIALPPEFSFPEGEYETMVPLKLSSNTTGSIYYTMGGVLPEPKEEMLYTAPLFLEAGNHIISAIFVNEYGIQSDIVSKEYTVFLAVPDAPEVLPNSGEYHEPSMIEIEEFDDITVYYTIDGTLPSEQSILYKGPIPMPLGNSTFRFVGYNEDGVAGEITERSYHLILDTDLTTDTACYDVIKKMIEIGKISDTIGTAVGLDGWYKYQFQYPISVEEQGYFYVIAELFQDMSGNREKTGTYYAMNIKDRTMYKFSKDASGNYLLEGF